MSLPKVLIFTPTYKGKDYCLKEFLDNVSKFTYKNTEHIFIDNTDDGGQYYEHLKKTCEPYGIRVFRVKRGSSSREALARAQNLARQIFLKGSFDYMLSLESDIFPKRNIIDALVMHDLDIITGLYMIGSKEDNTIHPCITIAEFVKDKQRYKTRLLHLEEFADYMGKGVKEVMAGGMGVCLMSRRVLEKVAFTFIPEHNKHSDVFFFNDARRLGFVVCVDTDLLCEHKNSDWSDVKDF